MDRIPDRRSSSLMGHYTVEVGYPDGQGAPPPPAPPPPQGFFPPYQGGPVFSSSFPPASPHSYNGTGYNSSEKYGQWLDEPASTQKFTRLVFATVVTLLISLSMASLVIWVLFGVGAPDFQVASFSVSKLAISSSTIRATWTSNITITNPESKLEVSDDSLKASILYKDYPLAMAAIEPKYIQAALNQGLNRVNFFFKLENETSISKGDLAAEIAEAEKAGVLLVSLRLAAGSQFVSDTGWSQDTLKVFCEDLKLLILPNGEGQLAGDSPRNCVIFA